MKSAAELHLRNLIMAKPAEQVAETGSITREQLTKLVVAGDPRRLIDRSRGIWNPRDLSATLSVVSSPDSEHADADLGNSLFRYDYRKGSTKGDNTKLRRAHELGLPIILLRKIRDGIYVPIFPVYVIGDDAQARQFVFALDESLRFLRDPLNPAADERAYAERITKQRLHQAEFRGCILRAYETQCAVCNLKHGRLLDAAHIIADGADDGAPIVNNGLSLCKIHHSAYDNNLMGISPDYVVHIDRDLMHERDGPMLRYGLQEMDGRALTTPKSRRERPDPERLEQRYSAFGRAS